MFCDKCCSISVNISRIELKFFKDLRKKGPQNVLKWQPNLSRRLLVIHGLPNFCGCFLVNAAILCAITSLIFVRFSWKLYQNMCNFKLNPKMYSSNWLSSAVLEILMRKGVAVLPTYAHIKGDLKYKSNMSSYIRAYLYLASAPPIPSSQTLGL